MHENFFHKLKIYYEDTDSGGVVYYANYLKFIERARTEMVYQQLGFKHNELKKIFDVIFVVKSCSIKYLKSAKFEDELTVITEILKKSKVRLVLQQEVKKNNELLVIAEVELAIVNSRGDVHKLPQELLDKL